MSNNLRPGEIRVKYGVHHTNVDGLVGRTVAQIRRSLSGPEQWNIDTRATPRVDGQPVNEDRPMAAGETLEFIKPLGEKAMSMTNEQMRDAAAAKLLADKAADDAKAEIRQIQQQVQQNMQHAVNVANNAAQTVAAATQAAREASMAVAGLRNEVAGVQASVANTVRSEVVASEGRVLTTLRGEVRSEVQKAGQQVAEAAAKASAAAVLEASKTFTAASAPMHHHVGLDMPMRQFEPAYGEKACSSKMAQSNEKAESKGRGFPIGFNPRAGLKALLVTSLLSLVSWGVNRQWHQMDFDSQFGQYVAAAKAAREAGEQDKAKKYADRAVAYLDQKGIVEGRTDVVLDAGPNADVGEWRQDVDKKLALISTTPLASNPDTEEALKQKLEPRPAPSGVFTGVATYPNNKGGFYWFAGSCGLAILSGLTLTISKKKKTATA